MTRAERFQHNADKLYTFIREYLLENARGPSQREMATHLGCSPNTVQKLLDHLERSGRGLHRVRGAWRRLWVPIRDMPEEVR